jgi:uncharacterized protein (DUF4415 family)
MPITRSTYKKRGGKLFLAKIEKNLPDLQPPEITESGVPTDADFDNGRIRLVHRGRPPKIAPKKRVDIRFDQDVLAGLKSYFGRGWSTKVNDTMRKLLARNGVI